MHDREEAKQCLQRATRKRVFVSILTHELGHAVMARRFDLHMRGITPFIFDGVAETSEEPPCAKAEFTVAIAEPSVW